jgi:hypothetical protein
MKNTFDFEKEKDCLFCQKKLIGRSDKKFCNDSCRSLYNHQKKERLDKIMCQSINKMLTHNRTILKSLYNRGGEISIDDLFINGFHSGFMTHKMISVKKDKFVFIYDYGYNMTKNGLVKIIHQEDIKLFPIQQELE